MSGTLTHVWLNISVQDVLEATAAVPEHRRLEETVVEVVNSDEVHSRFAVSTCTVLHGHFGYR